MERRGNQLAVVASRGLREYKTSYRHLANLARRFASELERRGISKGERVVIWGTNGAEWIAAFFGCVLRGVIAVPIDFASTLEFARRVTAEVSPRLITGDEEKLRPADFGASLLFFEDFAHSLPVTESEAIAGLAGSDTLQIVFTSGTTGEPKGVVHTHNNVLASLRPIEHEAQKYLKYEWIFYPIRILHTLPLSHVFGQFMGLWIPPLIRAEVHYENRLVATDLLEHIHKQRISVLASVPRVLDLLQQHLRERIPNLQQRLNSSGNTGALTRWWHFRDVHRLFGLKFWAFVCGGASLSPAAEQFWQALGFVVIQGYGMTETTALVSLNHPFRPARGTVGQVLPGREVKLSDEGEVLVRGETISNRTWQGGRLREGESEWLATGDLAEFDEKGNLRFRGRKKDVIVTSSGLNIYPEDLESALNRQAAVKTAAVVEMEGGHGPEPFAALVMKSGQDENAAAAVEAANGQLAEFQQIRRWSVWPEPDFPRTSTGKVLKREVARRIASQKGAALPGGDGDLNLDSLGRVELQARLEQQYGVVLDEAAVAQVKTAEDVSKLIAEPQTGAPQRRPAAQHIYPYWPWNPLMQAVRGVFLELIAMPLVRLLAKPAVENRIQDWPATPTLMVANHVTSYDVPLMLYALPGKVRRHVAVAMSGEMILDFRRGRNQGNWFLNLLAPVAYLLMTALFNIFPLPQMSGFRRSFRHAGEAIDRGYSVIVFPEGRRSEDGTAQPFKSGAGLLWRELGTPALPFRLEGLGEMKAHGKRWFRSGKLRVSAGPVVPLDRSKTTEELTDILRRNVFGQERTLG